MDKVVEFLFQRTAVHLQNGALPYAILMMGGLTEHQQHDIPNALYMKFNELLSQNGIDLDTISTVELLEIAWQKIRGSSYAWLFSLLAKTRLEGSSLSIKETIALELQSAAFDELIADVSREEVYGPRAVSRWQADTFIGFFT